MRWLAVTLGVLAAVATGVALWLRAPDEIAAPPKLPRVLAPAEVRAAAPPAESPAARKLDELNAMSESVRNSTFVIAIRAAGFVCEDVIGVDQAEAGAPAWRARCPDLHAYLVNVRDDGGLGVEPTIDHFDSVAPVFPVRPAPQNGPPDLLGPPDPRR
jgi:hypothetical protein